MKKLQTQDLKKRDYWPTKRWRISSPEKQGINSEKIYKLLLHIIDNKININSVLIVKNGYMVTEAYFHPYHKNYLHTIHSITKIIINALVGIAISEGYINSINDKVLDFFLDMDFKNVSDKKEKITIKNLVTSRTGIEWGDVINKEALEDIRILFDMAKSDNWVKFCLDREMAYEPGEMFNSNSPGGQLAALILKKTTGLKVMEYADRKIFSPLGITDYQWWINSNGENTGAQGLSLKPSDLMKLGYLYLNKGFWDGQSIIPYNWIIESTTGHFETRDSDKKNLLDKFGYMWYISSYVPYRNYNAYGAWGQFLSVIEDLDLSIVFTGDIPLDQFKLTVMNMIKDYIIPACDSENRFENNRSSLSKLNDLLERIENPDAEPCVKQSDISKKISNKKYVAKKDKFPSFFVDIFNTYLLKEFCLRFHNNEKCDLEIVFNDYRFIIPVGLNNKYLSSIVDGKFGKMDVFAKGFWENSRFIINYCTNMGRKNTFSINFSDDFREVSCFFDTHIFNGTISGEEKIN